MFRKMGKRLGQTLAWIITWRESKSNLNDGSHKRVKYLLFCNVTERDKDESIRLRFCGYFLFTLDSQGSPRDSKIICKFMMALNGIIKQSFHFKR